MAKNALRNLLFSACAVIVSCSTPPTYTRRNIEETVRAICRDEFSMNVTVKEKGETLWVYAPFERLLDDTGELAETPLEQVRNIFLSLKRVMLSIDKPPRFYVFVASDIRDKGLDIYQVGFVPDIVKYEMQFISRQEFQERVAFIPFENKDALGDTGGTHIAMVNFTMGDFITYLALQKIRNYYYQEPLKEHVEVYDINGSYKEGIIHITVDIMIQDAAGARAPFEVVKESIATFLKIYRDVGLDITMIEINDTFYEKKRSYSLRALMES